MLTLSDTLGHAQGRALLVGLSGGLDSTALLHLLATLGVPALRALHVNHGLHADAGRWAQHCQDTCAALGVPLTTAAVQIESASTLGPEGAARGARHAAFEAELRDDEVLVLAHHRDDQAETFLMRALRASGPDGLGAMRPWRQFGRGWLWRPLLGTSRAAILEHARRHGLQWIDDPSNADDAFDRNFLRQQVLPLLRERWPHVDAAFARSAARSADASSLLDEDDARALDAVATDHPDRIDAVLLGALDPTRRARVLRRWVASLGLPPLPAQGIATIERDLLRPRSAGVAEFAWAGGIVHRWRGLLHAGRVRRPLPNGWQAQWDGRAPMGLPDGATLLLRGCDGFDAPLSVMSRRGGERIQLAGRSHSHALKHVLQEAGVPPWVRSRLPLLSDAEGALLAAGDRVYSGAFDAWLRGRHAHLAWVSD